MARGPFSGVEATVPNTRELRGFLLKYAADLEVLEPRELRQEFATIGEALAQAHCATAERTRSTRIRATDADNGRQIKET